MLSQRFCAAWDAWSQGQVKQSENRSLNGFPSVEDFIVMRRATIGGGMVEGMYTFFRTVMYTCLLSICSDYSVFSEYRPSRFCAHTSDGGKHVGHCSGSDGMAECMYLLRSGFTTSTDPLMEQDLCSFNASTLIAIVIIYRIILIL